MARITSFPRPTLTDLPKAADPHHCPAFTIPVAVYVDRFGGWWREYECQVCGDTFAAPTGQEVAWW